MKKLFFLVFLNILLFINFNTVRQSLVFAQTPTPVTIDIDTITNQLGQQLNCGKIGQSCCVNLDIPVLQITKPNIAPGLDQVIGYVTDFINGVMIKLRSFYIWVGGFFNPAIREILCSEGIPSDRKNLSNCQCLPKDTFNIAKLCVNIKDPVEKSSCISCSQHGVFTAIGCIDFKLENFIKEKVFGFGIGLAGIIALLCIIYSAFQIQTSQGNPEKIKKAQELLTSCIMGLMLIIFSVFILRLIGFDILRIPDFK